MAWVWACRGGRARRPAGQRTRPRALGLQKARGHASAYLQPGGDSEWKVERENISARSAIFPGKAGGCGGRGEPAARAAPPPGHALRHAPSAPRDSPRRPPAGAPQRGRGRSLRGPGARAVRGEGQASRADGGRGESGWGPGRPRGPAHLEEARRGLWGSLAEGVRAQEPRDRPGSRPAGLGSADPGNRRPVAVWSSGSCPPFGADRAELSVPCAELELSAPSADRGRSGLSAQGC